MVLWDSSLLSSFFSISFKDLLTPAVMSALNFSCVSFLLVSAAILEVLNSARVAFIVEIMVSMLSESVAVCDVWSSSYLVMLEFMIC